MLIILSNFILIKVPVLSKNVSFFVVVACHATARVKDHYVFIFRRRFSDIIKVAFWKLPHDVPLPSIAHVLFWYLRWAGGP